MAKDTKKKGFGSNFKPAKSNVVAAKKGSMPKKHDCGCGGRGK